MNRTAAANAVMGGTECGRCDQKGRKQAFPAVDSVKYEGFVNILQNPSLPWFLFDIPDH